MKAKKGLLNEALKAGIWYTLCSIILKGATMLLTPVYARLMTTAEYGNNASIGTWFTMLATIVTVDLCNSVNRAKYDFPGQLDQFISSVTWLGTLATAACYLVVLIFSDFFCALFSCGVEYIHVMFGALMFSPAMSMLQTKNRLENRYHKVVALSLFSWVLSSGTSIMMLVCDNIRNSLMGGYASDRVFSMFAGSHFTGFIINFSIYLALMLRGRCLIRWEYWRYALAICLPLIPHLLAGNVLTSSDRIMIRNMCGAEMTALYSITYTCSAIVSMFFNALNQAWVPWFNDKYYYNRDEDVRRVSTIYFLIFFLITLGCIVIAPELLLIMGGRKYMQAVEIMPVVMISCFFQFTNAFFVNVEMFEKRTMFTATGTMIAAALNVALNYLLIPVFGYQAAAYTTLAGFAFLFTYHGVICYRLIGAKLSRLYPIRLFLACLGVMICLIVPAIWLYSYPLLRYALCIAAVALFIAGVWKYKEEILGFFKQRQR